MIIDWETDMRSDPHSAAQYRVPMPGLEDSGLYLIDSTKLDKLTELIHLEIANLVADLIGAGSERDAVLENDLLRDAIFDELKGWSDHADNNPQNIHMES